MCPNLIVVHLERILGNIFLLGNINELGNIYELGNVIINLVITPILPKQLHFELGYITIILLPQLFGAFQVDKEVFKLKVMFQVNSKWICISNFISIFPNKSVNHLKCKSDKFFPRHKVRNIELLVRAGQKGMQHLGA